MTRVNFKQIRLSPLQRCWLSDFLRAWCQMIRHRLRRDEQLQRWLQT